MANKHRGEVDIEIAGVVYPIAFTLDAMGRIAEALGVKKLDEVSTRVGEMNIADFQPILAGLLEGNGHLVTSDEIARLPVTAYTDLLTALFTRQPAAEADKTSPRSRAKN
jgi:hypothetical protein